MTYNIEMIVSAALTLTVLAYPLVRLVNFTGDVVQKL